MNLSIQYEYCPFGRRNMPRNLCGRIFKNTVNQTYRYRLRFVSAQYSREWRRRVIHLFLHFQKRKVFAMRANYNIFYDSIKKNRLEFSSHNYKLKLKYEIFISADSYPIIPSNNSNINLRVSKRTHWLGTNCYTHKLTDYTSLPVYWYTNTEGGLIKIDSPALYLHYDRFPPDRRV